MKKYIPLLSSFIILLVQMSCNEDKEASPEVPERLITQTLAMFEGEVIEQEFENEEGIELWEIKIRNPLGSIVSFYWTYSNEDLFKIEGTQEPFDYELNPGMNLINYSTARTFAVSAIKNDEILSWELEQNDDFIDKWVYEFEMNDNGDTRKVYVDALTGDVLQID